MLLTRQTAAERAAIERAWRRIEPLALYPRPLDVGGCASGQRPVAVSATVVRRFDGYTIWSTIMLRERLDAG